MHSLAPYGIRAHDQKLAGPKDQRYHRLNNIRGLDLINELNQFCAKHSSSYTTVEDETLKRAIKITDVAVRGRELFGYIEYGEYGTKGKVINIVNNSTVYTKSTKDSDVHQLYFHFLVPLDTTNAIAVFHNIHGHGAKGAFTKMFSAYFKDKSNGLSLQFNPLTYEKVATEWMKNANIKELRLQKYKPKNELSDAVSTLQEHTIDITLKPNKKGGIFGSFLDFYKDDKIEGSQRGAIELLGEQCHNIKALVEHDGRRRVFSLAANSSPLSNIDFDENDVVMDDGVPSFDSLRDYSSLLLSDLMQTT